jgi:F-type H+-transporting ATPase subunit b
MWLRKLRKKLRKKTCDISRPLLVLIVLAFVSAISSRTFASAQAQPTAQPSQTTAEPAKSEPAKPEDKQAPGHKGFGGELAQETREATGAEEEEHAELKHAFPIQWLAKKIGLGVHKTHLLLLGLNFAIVAVLIGWAAFKFLPGMFRSRNASIQQALEEARAASQDANRRLADIENRLRQLDVEIGQMQATAEKEAEAEESRIVKSTAEEIRKVVQAAEHEIDIAAKLARRELTNHTASLAITLARQQINVDSNTDQVLVRTFASSLARNDGGKDGQ